MPERFARRNVQKVRDADALEARRLLKAVGNAASGAVGDRKGRDVFAVPDNLAFGGRNKAHDGFGKRRLAAAVGARDDDEFSIVDGQIDMLISTVPLSADAEKLKFFSSSIIFPLFPQLSE